MSAEDDGVPGGKLPAEMQAGLGMRGFVTAMEEPAAGCGIVGKDRSVDYDESVSGFPGLFQQFLDF
jgi:hypothetical protein